MLKSLLYTISYCPPPLFIFISPNLIFLGNNLRPPRALLCVLNGSPGARPPVRRRPPFYLRPQVTWSSVILAYCACRGFGICIHAGFNETVYLYINGLFVYVYIYTVHFNKTYLFFHYFLREYLSCSNDRYSKPISVDGEIYSNYISSFVQYSV